MEFRDNVQKLLNSQKDIVREYEQLLKKINSADSISENIELKKEIARLQKDLLDAEKKVAELQHENISITISLKEQMLNERNLILNASKKKIELYFCNEEKSAMNRLQWVENSLKAKIHKIKMIAFGELKQQDEQINHAIDTIGRELDEKIKLEKEKLRQSYQKAIDEIKVEYDALEEEISDEMLAKKKKHNDIEVKIGLNWINKIGIILLLLGVATGMKYTYSQWLNDYMKGISGFLLGGAILAAGEWFNKKDKNLFALSLCGGGIGVLYLTVFSSYFFLNILSLPISIFVSILITVGAISLSQRYQSMTIAGISLFGGYLPFFSYVLIEGIQGMAIYVAMGYLMILNLLVLMIAFERRWIYINYLSFIFNIPCLLYLTLKADNEIIAITYGLLTFIMYLGITLAYPMRKNIKLTKADLVLLGMNTVINCLLVYRLFDIAGFDKYKGFLALIYAVGYFGLSRMMAHQSSQEKYVQALFSITALTFSILMIPFQFGVEWAAMGWLIEAILILTFAKRYDIEKIELGGWIIIGLCTLSFFIYDFTIGWQVEYFVFRYSFLTVGLLYAFSLYIPEYNKRQMIKYTHKGKLFNLFKYFVVLNCWVYLLRMFLRLYDQLIAPKIPHAYIGFYKSMVIAMVTIIFAYGILKIEAIKDKVTVGISTVLLILSIILCISLNVTSVGGPPNPTARAISIIILILYNLLALISVKDIMIGLIKRKRINIEYYPLTIVIYLLGVISLFLTQQFNLQNINLIISIIFVISSLACIIFGFKKNYLFIRRFGLGLSILSTIKLFIFDLRNLTGGGKIIAYFCFGLALLGISFIYQRLKTNLIEVTNDEKIS